MKILLATSEHDEKIAALLQFKQLNIAHSVDFVSTKEELKEYIHSNLNARTRLPDLILLDLNMDNHIGVDTLSMISSNFDKPKLQIIFFTTQPLLNSKAVRELRTSIVEKYNDHELTWILGEICNTLVGRKGWKYQIKSLKDEEEVSLTNVLV